MSASSDIAAVVTCDPSNFTAGMTVVREQLTQTTTAIQVQDQTWKTFTSSVLESTAKIVAPVLRLMNTYKQMQLATMMMASANAAAIAPTLGLAGAVNFLLSPVVLTAAAVAALSAAIYYFSGAQTQAEKTTVRTGDAAEDTRTSYERLRDSIVATAREHLGDENLQSIASMGREVLRLKDNLSELAESLRTPFLDGVTSMQAFVQSMIPVESVTGFIKSGLSQINEYLDQQKPKVAAAAASWTAFAIGFANGMSTANGQELVDIGAAIRGQTELISKLEEQRSAFQDLRKIQDDAAAQAQRNAEVSRISSITTIDGINAEITALQQRSADAIRNGEADDAWKQQTEALFQALEKQRQGILNGTVIDRQAIESKRALQKAEEDAAKAAQRAWEQDERKTKDGQEKIQSLRDQIDLLNGSATKADIAMREMLRQGFTADQILKTGELTAELERLREEEGKLQETKKADTGKRLSQAAEAGSSAALSIIANATASRDPVADNTKKLVDEAKKQNQQLEKIAVGVGDFQTVSVVELPA